MYIYTVYTCLIAYTHKSNAHVSIFEEQYNEYKQTQLVHYHLHVQSSKSDFMKSKLP